MSELPPDMDKANFTASNGEVVPFPDGAVFLDEAPVHHADGGIVVDGNGGLHSLARPEMVSNGVASLEDTEPHQILSNRIGQVFIHENEESKQTSYGVELEYAYLNPDSGEYVVQPDNNELYTFMGESGTKQPAYDPEQLEASYKDMVGEIVDSAENRGIIAAPIGVIGQREPKADEINPHPYVQHVAGNMSRATGFDTIPTFRVLGLQDHTGISNTQASLRAAEAMQAWNPILMSPSLAGPYAHGGMAGNLSGMPLTDKQRVHMDRMDIRQEDLGADYQSRRYMLRRLGSTGAGIWLEQAPDDVDSYLGEAHDLLANGEINTIDRWRGSHADRVRSAFNGSGASTFEGCASDTFAGNVEVASSVHLLRSGLFTSLEAMAMRGEDPVAHTARMLGTGALSRQARLDTAHHLSLREVARHGNDATVYGGKTPGEWLPDMLDLADQAPFTRLEGTQRDRLAGAFATWAETKDEIAKWCADNETNVPTMQAYFDTGLNNPAVYMRAQHDALLAEGEATDSQDATRKVELSLGQAFHRSAA